MEYYKERPTNKAEYHKFGIYSIKQRDREKSISTVSRNTNLQLTITNNNCAATDFSYGTLNDNSFGKAIKIKDRVQNISQKVDTMKINDTTDAGPFAKDENDESSREEKKTGNRKKSTNHQYVDIDDSNKMCNEDKVKTQGDTLNEIKAMRRRHPRLVNTLYANLFWFILYFFLLFFFFLSVFTIQILILLMLFLISFDFFFLFYSDQAAMIQRLLRVNTIHALVRCHFDRKRRRQH